MKEIKTFEQRKEELLKKGKEKGVLTYEELAENLKGLELDADSLDELYNAFHDNNIEIISENFEDEDDSDDDGEEISIEDVALPKNASINDPVRMYLKEIGKISLLSLDEELALSKRVEEGDEEDEREVQLAERLENQYHGDVQHEEVHD